MKYIAEWRTMMNTQKVAIRNITRSSIKVDDVFVCVLFFSYVRMLGCKVQVRMWHVIIYSDTSAMDGGRDLLGHI